jgi:hypothetical protein
MNWLNQHQMKKIVLFLLIVLVISCKNEAKSTTVKKEILPDELAKVLEKHGGLDTWKKAKILSFNIGEEAHTSDLQSRKIVINSPKYSLGFNGKEIWLDQTDTAAFKGNKDFYYNLYFYFYAMPFVLANDGIIYEKESDLIFEGKNYPGYKISFKANVGTSSDDNYKIYYDPESYQMQWLAYTVTFKSKAPNNDYHIIKYNKWENVNGLILPNEITWYKMDEKGMPTVPQRPATVFTLPLVSEGKLADSFFEKPKN